MTTVNNVTGGSVAPTTLVARAISNLALWTMALFRPRHARRPRRIARRDVVRLAIWSLVTIAVIVATMELLDARAVAYGRMLPHGFIQAGQFISDYAKGDWIIVPASLTLIASAALASPDLGRATYGVLLRIGAASGFVILAVALPGLTVSVVKRLIGRARPGRIEGSDLYFAPFSWNSNLASFPSGHATTAFAAAVALGVLFPRARGALFFYAALMALSRIVVAAHYPSDVIAGAVVGSVGALLVRAWFASGRLGFFVSSAARIERLPGPSRRRVAQAMRKALARP